MGANGTVPFPAARRRGRGPVASIRKRGNAGFGYWLIAGGIDAALAR